MFTKHQLNKFGDYEITFYSTWSIAVNIPFALSVSYNIKYRSWGILISQLPFRDEELNNLPIRRSYLFPHPLFSLKTKAMKHTILIQIKELLKKNLSNADFGIPEVCEALNISRTHLHRKITQETGLSTSHYIRLLRMEEAKSLLTTTDLLVYEVANQVGCKNVAYFSTSFLAVFGYSPRAVKELVEMEE